jgi:tripartite-type tricarboxylate transporter receptor subunit TctC
LLITIETALLFPIKSLKNDGGNKMLHKRQQLRIVLFVFTLILVISFGFQGQAADFYKGKKLKLFVAYEAGSSQDREARMVAEFLPKHIPGNPSVIIVNMPGAGGLQAVKYVFSAVKPDGLSCGFFGASVPTEKLMAKDRASQAALDIDINQFNWIGSMGGKAYIFIVRGDTPYKSIYDLLKATTPLKAGATRPGSTTFIGPATLKATLKAPLDIVTGYRGGSDRDLAFFRGEVQFIYTSWTSMTKRYMDWLADNTARPILLAGKRLSAKEVKKQLGTTKIPHILDIVKKPDDVSLVGLAMTPGEWGRLVAAPPGTPPERVQLLIKAIRSMSQDPAFLLKNKKVGLALSPIPGNVVKKMIRDYLNTKPSIVKRYIEMVESS